MILPGVEVGNICFYVAIIRNLNTKLVRVKIGEVNMLNILEFIFKDFWHFTGIVILLSIISDGVRGMFK